MLNDSLFKGRQLKVPRRRLDAVACVVATLTHLRARALLRSKVTAKRTNVPPWQLSRGGGAAGFAPRGARGVVGGLEHARSRHALQGAAHFVARRAVHFAAERARADAADINIDRTENEKTRDI